MCTAFNLVYIFQGQPKQHYFIYCIFCFTCLVCELTGRQTMISTHSNPQDEPLNCVPTGIVGCDTVAIATGTPGCPKLHPNLELAELMVDAGYSLTEVAKALLVSRKIYRHL